MHGAMTRHTEGTVRTREKQQVSHGHAYLRVYTQELCVETHTHTPGHSACWIKTSSNMRCHPPARFLCSHGMCLTHTDLVANSARATVLLQLNKLI